MSHSSLKINGRKIHIIDSGCDLSPRMHFVWIGQLSPDFGVVFGGNDDEAHEYFADAIGFTALSNGYIGGLVDDIKKDEPGISDGDAYTQATEGMLALSGGAEWIDQDDWGFWTPSEEERATLKIACDTLRNLE